MDAATSAERQRLVFDTILDVLKLDFEFETTEEARGVMVKAQDLFRNWNYAAWDSEEFKKILADIDRFVEAKGRVEATA